MAHAQQVITGNGDDSRTLVVVFLRGGADGLSMVAPVEDDGYFQARPRIAIHKKKAIALDGAYLRAKCQEDAVLGYELLKRITTHVIERLSALRAKV
mgnify:CR=1 FL=1